MKLTAAARNELPEIIALYHRVADEMEAEGLRQWHWGIYPNEKLLEEDQEKGELYIARENGQLIAAAVVFTEQEAEYETVNWGWGLRPGIFHRLVVAPEFRGRGLAREAVKAIEDILREKGCDCIRCDTSEENTRALKLYDSGMGYVRRGTVAWYGDDQQFICFDHPLTDNAPMLPVPMTPAFRGGKLTPWGGEKLKTVFGKELKEIPTGESLEVSCIPGLESTDPMGRKLPDLIAAYGSKMAGIYAGKPFPLLLKLIDAREALSVQVHPDDEYAGTHEDGKLGKTEAWLILDAPEGSELVYGIVPGTDLETLRKACEAGSAVAPLLRRVAVRPGDVCYIPAGCVHAIGAGITLYEIQQSSDITYRFYDWDRTDAQGKKRELHLDKALDVTDLSLEPMPTHAADAEGVERILDKTYFTLDLVRVKGGKEVLPAVNEFGMITGLEGDVRLTWEGGGIALAKGKSCFLPASAPKLFLEGNGTAAVSMPK